MTEILHLSPAGNNEPRIEYKFEEKETTAVDDVFNMLFELLLKEDNL